MLVADYTISQIVIFSGLNFISLTIYFSLDYSVLKKIAQGSIFNVEEAKGPH